MNVDEYGILGQIQKDGSVEGGDSANWMGHWVYLENFRYPFVETFEVDFGAYARHPALFNTNNGFGAHYKNPWNGCISRDQLTGILAALIKQEEYKAMLRLIIHHAAWLFLFSYNTIKNGQKPSKAKWKWPDLTLFDIWACELRGLGIFSWFMWPLLCVLDIHMFVGALFQRASKDPDVISFAMKFFISRDYVPTPTSWLTSKVIDRKKLIKDLETYWCGWRDQCFMKDLYEEHLYFS